MVSSTISTSSAASACFVRQSAVLSCGVRDHRHLREISPVTSDLSAVTSPTRAVITTGVVSSSTSQLPCTCSCVIVYVYVYVCVIVFVCATDGQDGAARHQRVHDHHHKARAHLHFQAHISLSKLHLCVVVVRGTSTSTSANPFNCEDARWPTLAAALLEAVERAGML